jgi:putative ABC transport system permease protein
VVSHALARGPLSDLAGLQILSFAPGPVALVIVLVMAIAFIAGTLPAWRAARQNPIDSLRYE